MIAALLLVCQLAGAAAAPLAVRLEGRTADVPVATRNGLDVVRADVLALALEGTVERVDRLRWALVVGGARVEFTAQVPFARRGEEVIPLAVAPFVLDDRLYLPLQVVSEVVPRLGDGLRYDVATRELRRAPAAGVAGRAATPAGAPATTAAAAAPADQRPTALPVVKEPGPRLSVARTVIVDAGHGGPDRGMRGARRGGGTVFEKDVTLAVSHKVAAELRRRGVKVVMTRSSDTLIALGDRGRIANRAHGDLFMSIHVNAANPNWRNASAARGFETYFLAEAKTEDARRVAEMENASEQYETVTPTTKGDPLSFIISDMKQNEYLRESSDLAASVQRHLKRVHPGPDRGVKQAGFKVLVTASMPAVLVELGFGSNPSEAAYLSDAAEQARLAGVLVDATMEYLAQLDRRTGGGHP